MAVLKFKDKNGNWSMIPALVGATGLKGDKGEDGKTPVKGTDYWTAADKAEIIEEVFNKAILKTQDVSNVGKILVVGADGNITFADMPTGGGTDADIIGTIDENNTIVLSSELSLADGTYVFKYENVDGTYSEIGTLVIGGVVEYAIKTTLTNCEGTSGNVLVIASGKTVTLIFTANKGYALPESVAVSGASYTWDYETGTLMLSNPTKDVKVTISAVVYTPYTNVLPLAQEYASTSPYVGANGTVGYGEGMRISTSSATTTYMKADTTAAIDTTGLIPVKRGDIIRLKNCNLKVTPANTNYGTRVYGFNSSKAIVSGFSLIPSGFSNRVPTVVENGEYVQFTLEPLEAWTTSDIDSVAYIMISTDDLNENSIITVNEDITE